MELKLRLQRMLQILEDVERAGVMSDLEKDMILADLREAYSEVKFGVVLSENSAPAQAEPEESVEPEMEVEIVFAEEDEVEENGAEAQSEPKVESEPEAEKVEEPTEGPSVATVVAPIAAAAVATTATAAEAVATEVVAPAVESVVESVVEATAEPTTEPAVETVAEPIAEQVAEASAVESIVEPVAEPVAAPIEEKPVATEAPVEDDDLSIVNSQLSANKPHRNAILSLYEEAPAIVGEQFRDNSTSVADMIASSAKSVASAAPISSLNDAIGVADKFMLVHELFGGDDAAYNSAINTLDSLPSFDDCVIFISENYTWSPNSEGTKFMMELLQRKYNA